MLGTLPVRALAREGAQHVEHLVARDRVEPGRDLVQHEQLGAM